jgi:uncharacterized protein
MTDVGLKQTINNEVKDAMRAKAKERLATLRLVTAEIKRVEVDERIEVDDARVLIILDKMCKQRRDSITQYVQGGREDLADVERYEIEVIQSFLPEALTAEELSAIVNKAIADSGASNMQEMGKAMALIKPQVQGRADMGEVSKLIKAKLA